MRRLFCILFGHGPENGSVEAGRWVWRCLSCGRRS